MKVNLDELRQISSNPDGLDNYIDGVFAKSSHDDPPGLTELIIAAANGSQPMLSALAHRFETDRDRPYEDRFVWNLQILRDEWGNQLEPGDKYRLKRNKPLHHKPGKPVTSDELSMDKINGDYDRKWTTVREYTVDKKGCISVEFRDAVTLLNTRGIHYIGRRPIGVTNLREQTEAPAMAPNGQMHNVWYWQVCECPKAVYDKLPELVNNGKPKRGIDSPEAIKVWEKKTKENNK